MSQHVETSVFQTLSKAGQQHTIHFKTNIFRFFCSLNMKMKMLIYDNGEFINIALIYREANWEVWKKELIESDILFQLKMY